ncbi:MAG: DUF924 domain-containing protein [Proteobacteria bacterium]|nr:DUF924 domain-containing protein [Pseudomonadota bacterium]
MSIVPHEIVDFWVEVVGEKRWYIAEPALDDLIRKNYESLWYEARAGTLSTWMDTAEGALALLIVLDQFPRNMFRGKADAFASDAQARSVADRAVAQGLDLQIEPPLRQFFYLPFEHSETLADQDRSVALFGGRLGKDHYTYPYALSHRAEIARFGRFPSRNKALGRTSTAEEQDYLSRK